MAIELAYAIWLVLVISVCGLLLSTSFVVLFFLLKEKNLHIQTGILILLFVSIAFSHLFDVLSLLAICIANTPSAY